MLDIARKALLGMQQSRIKVRIDFRAELSDGGRSHKKSPFFFFLVK